MYQNSYVVYIMTVVFACSLLVAEANGSREDKLLLKQHLTERMKHVLWVMEQKEKIYGNGTSRNVSSEEINRKGGDISSDYSTSKERKANVTFAAALNIARNKVDEWLSTVSPALKTSQWKSGHYFYLAIAVVVILS